MSPTTMTRPSLRSLSMPSLRLLHFHPSRLPCSVLFWHHYSQHRWKCAEIVLWTVSYARLLHRTATQFGPPFVRNHPRNLDKWSSSLLHKAATQMARGVVFAVGSVLLSASSSPRCSEPDRSSRNLAIIADGQSQDRTPTIARSNGAGRSRDRAFEICCRSTM